MRGMRRCRRRVGTTRRSREGRSLDGRSVMILKSSFQRSGNRGDRLAARTSFVRRPSTRSRRHDQLVVSSQIPPRSSKCPGAPNRHTPSFFFKAN